MTDSTTKKLDIRLPADIRERIDALAEQRTNESKVTVKAADIVREALALYFNESATLQRGGSRDGAGRPFGAKDRRPRKPRAS